MLALCLLCAYVLVPLCLRSACLLLAVVVVCQLAACIVFVRCLFIDSLLIVFRLCCMAVG